MNTDSRIHYLFIQYLNGHADPEETTEFLLLVNDPEQKATFYQLMDQYLAEEKFSEGLDDDQKDAVLTQIFKTPENISLPSLETKKLPVVAEQPLDSEDFPVTVRTLPLWKKVLAAAVVLLTLSAAFYFSMRNRGGDNLHYTAYQGEIKAGGNKATLILADGTKVCLTDAANGKIAEEADARIRKSADGRIVYELKSPENNGQPQKEPQYNIVSTPAGGQYQVLLPDGTHVWLNAASSLKYPTSFAAFKERRVELTGEAYFEVSKITRATGRMPFVVKSSGQEVEVLGTHFNISSYEEEKASVTTLLEGSVRVSRPGAFEEVIAPGEQALVNRTIKVSKADTSTAVAWKNGIFKFDNANIYTVMNQLSRWYDIDVEYRGKAPANTFNGEIYRNMDASKAFRILSLARISFRLETPVNHQGRKKIIITQN